LVAPDFGELLKIIQDMTAAHMPFYQVSTFFFVLDGTWNLILTVLAEIGFGRYRTW
jgi:hypothetical protein